MKISANRQPSVTRPRVALTEGTQRSNVSQCLCGVLLVLLRKIFEEVFESSSPGVHEARLCGLVGPMAFLELSQSAVQPGQHGLFCYIIPTQQCSHSAPYNHPDVCPGRLYYSRPARCGHGCQSLVQHSNPLV
ncbi:hypothetical protein ACFXAE_01060 [Streptomyces sp. NPDC059454]|uniref:hypothetical protein n=1 Tax=Streptomyces sp. NPDC059454 TaxID=3346836 RepID=UPI00369EC6A7